MMAQILKLKGPLVGSLAAVVLFSVGLMASADNSQLNESVPARKVISVGLSQSINPWTITGNTNAAVAAASISGASLLIRGLQLGTTTVQTCTDTSNCVTVNVTVTSSPQVLGASITAPHSSGSWILSAGTVYYVYGQSLIGVPSWKIFVSNRGTGKKIQAATDSDMTLPQLSPMALKDSRVK